MVDRALQRMLKPQLCPIGKSCFCVQLCGKNGRQHSVILLMNHRSKHLVCYVSRSFCSLKFTSKVLSLKWAKSVIPEINALSLFVKALFKDSVKRNKWVYPSAVPAREVFYLCWILGQKNYPKGVQLNVVGSGEWVVVVGLGRGSIARWCG